MFIDAMKIDTDNIETYNYELPLDRIAEYPLAERDQSKLLVYKDNHIADEKFASVVDLLPANTLLVFNNTRVVQARFLFQTPTGAIVEIFSLEPAEGQGGPAESMTARERVIWKCFVGNAKRWKQPELIREVLLESGQQLAFHARQLEQREDYYVIEFCWNVKEITFSEIFSLLGDLPLPPYMKRKTEASDKERYQTVYAKNEGSVAAPTAGLHFTGPILEKLLHKGIQTEEVTLHVGAGTFKPVKTNSINEHTMHSEYIHVHRTTVERIRNQNNLLITPVGTTSMRTLESLYWLGCKLNATPDLASSIPYLNQWDAYVLPTLSISESMDSLLRYMDSLVDPHGFSAKTALLIKPGYDFKICKALITNFHQPKSTLLCLVASFIGLSGMKQVYSHALKHEYRFLSYGDSSLLFKHTRS